MSRPTVLEENLVVSARIEKSMYQMLHDIASLESINTLNKRLAHKLKKQYVTRKKKELR
jgi:hypothetical protein